MAYQTLQQEYFQIPVVTRAYTTACVLTTAAVVRSFFKRSTELDRGLLNNELYGSLALARGSVSVNAMDGTCQE